MATRPKPPCEHFDGLAPVTAHDRGCDACAATGVKDWNELRICLVCGHVGCCEDSRHAHALAHFQATGHAAMASIEPGQHWGWCYAHQRYVEPLPEGLLTRPRRGWLRRLIGG